MKKLLLTTLITVAALQGFSQDEKREIEKFMIPIFKEAMPNRDTMLILNTLDSMAQVNPSKELLEFFADASDKFNKMDFLIKSLEKSAKVNKDSHILKAVLGAIYMRESRYKDAINSYKKFLSKSDTNTNMYMAGLYENIAVCYMQLGKFKKADTYFYKALDSEDLELHNTHYFIYLRYAQNLNKLGEYDKSIEILDSISSDGFDRSRVGSSNIEGVYGEAYYGKKDYKTAITHFKKQLNNYTDDVTAMYYAAQCYEKLGDTGNACAYYKMSVKNYEENQPSRKEEKAFTKIHSNKLFVGRIKNAQKQIEKLNCQ